MESAHPVVHAKRPHLRQRLRAQTRAAKRSLDEQVVHEGILAAKLQAMAERDHDITDILGFRLNQPDVSKPTVGQQRGESIGGARSDPAG